MTEFVIRQILKSGINGALGNTFLLTLASINSNLQKEITIPSTGSTIQIKASDSVKIDDSHLDLAARFNFKFNNTKKHLRMLTEEATMDDTEDLKVRIMNNFLDPY